MCVLDAKVKDFGDLLIPNQDVGNIDLNVYPFVQTGSYIKLPHVFKQWEETLNEIMKYVPIQKGATTHYITINSEFFTKEGFQRTEGVHIDGNFCVDPTFVDMSNHPIKGWGGASPCPQPGWGGILPKDRELLAKSDNSHVIMDWVLPYKVTIPVGKYVSDTKGGIFIVSSEVGTDAWSGKFEGNVQALGSMEAFKEQFTKDNLCKIPKNKLVFMTSNTPHETLKVPKGTRRTFMRLTLNHNYDNTNILGE